MSDLVTITAGRLLELEAAAAAVQILKEKLKKANHCDIDKINAYNKAHPEKAAERSKRCKEKNREAYNARRRELRRLKKEADSTAPAVQTSTVVDAPNLNPGP